MIHRKVWHNDRLADVEEVRLSPGQAGLLNGWGLFTTLRVFDGVPFAFERHWKRLQKDAARTHLPFPFDAETVRGQLDQVLRANGVKEGTARIYVVHNQTGFWTSEEKFPAVDLILYSAGLPAYREPVRLALREHGRHAASPLAGVKTTAWLNNVWNLHEAQQRGFDEVILLDEHGIVSECTAANIFCAKEWTVYTPPLTTGCLEGITRGILMEISPRAGVPVEEKLMTPEDLYAADEIFISSTNRSLLAVGEIEGRKIKQAPGQVMQRLEKAFAAFVSNYLAKRAAAVK